MSLISRKLSERLFVAHAIGLRRFLATTTATSAGKDDQSKHDANKESHSYPLQQETNQDAPLTKGYNLILSRVANMIVNVTEKHVAKVLHVYPEQALQAYLGKISHVELNGYSTAKESHRDFKWKNKYNHIEYETKAIDTLQEIPFRSSAYDIVIQCLPILHPDPIPSTMTHNTPITMIAPPSLPIQEMLRILNHKGFLIVGYPEYLWEQYQVQKVLQELSSTDKQSAKGEFLVFQKVSLPIQDIAIFQEGVDDEQIQDWMAFDTMTTQQSTRSGPPVRKAHDGTMINHNPNSDSNKSNAEVAVKYCLAMFRKK